MQPKSKKKRLSLFELFKSSATVKKTNTEDKQKALNGLLAGIDNAILSGAEMDRVVDLFFRYSFNIIQSHYVAFISLGKTVNDKIATKVLYADGTTKQYASISDKSLKNIFRDNTAGAFIQNADKYATLTPLVTAASPQTYACPIYKEGEVAAILLFGLSDTKQITDQEKNHGLEIANRLAVAKTATHRMQQLKIIEYFDPVTDLYNRQACQDRLSQEMSRARRQSSKLATFFININGFKKINDEFGYVVGDQLLRDVAQKLKSSLRDIDILARFSADEFVVIATEIEKSSHANRLANKINALFLTPFQINEHEIHINISMGISIYPDDGITVNEIIHHADAARMISKKQGLGQYAFYEENMSARDIWESTVARELRLAVTNNELFMVYQPQFNDRNGEIVGIEALVRWQHPERGLVSPAEFIKIAEQTGYIVQLGQHTRQLVFNQYANWTLAGVDLPRVALNLSSYEINRSEFIPEFKKLLEDTGVPTELIEFEITENLFVETKGIVLDNLKTLHQMGVHIAIDDFGTGYSNLGYLVRLPFDVLKIDRSFMQEIGKYSGSTQIITMMIDIGHHLGKLVCAEGVENEEQLKFLIDSGCDMIQGFLLSKPLSSNSLLELLNQKQVKTVRLEAA
jgi:diguanylate cyclase (GGDEF)-like protein